MKETTYITGHRNPDTDSIASAIAYADFKRQTSKGTYLPIRLGSLNKETTYVLDRFGFQPPKLLESMKAQVEDLNFDQALCVDENMSLYEAVNLLQDEQRHTLFITEEDKLFGIVSLQDLWRSYGDVWADEILYDAQTPIKNILKVLRGTLLVGRGDLVNRRGAMRVFANAPENSTNSIKENDVVIVGDREEYQEAALDRRVSIMILTRNAKVSKRILEKAKELDVMVIRTPLSTFMTARLLPQAVPVGYQSSKSNLKVFYLDQDLDEVQEEVVKSRFGAYPVLDDQDRVVGSLARAHLLRYKKPKLILVDHNESKQSVEDIEEAEIIEIIDHHRVAAPMSNEPIFFRNEPVGSTASIISKLYFEYGLDPSPEIAGLLLSAILSDTLEFRSPTSTRQDEYLADRLAKIAGLDLHAYAMELFEAGTSFSKSDIGSLVRGDVKVFQVKGKQCRIGQAFTMNLEAGKSMEKDFSKAMLDVLAESKEDVFVFMLTDILKEESLLIVEGPCKKTIQSHISQNWKTGGKIIPKLLSRKKQALPKVIEALS